MKQLPRDSRAPSTLFLKFKDGKEMKFNFEDEEFTGREKGSQREQLKLADVIAEVDRHSRLLERKEDLAG